METGIVESMIDIIKAERELRLARLPREYADDASDQWYLFDEPLINELCLLLLVAIRHQVERELVLMAARAGHDGRELDDGEYRQQVQQVLALRNRTRWKKVEKELKLSSFEEWTSSSMKTLQLLSNVYKHDPFATPDKDLLRHLSLQLELDYDHLRESSALRKGASLGLRDRADYIDIAEELLARAKRFLTHVEEKSTLSSVNRGVVPLGEFAH